MSQRSAPPFRMPAEWGPHAATWIAWPHNVDDWPGKFQPIPWVYAEIVRYLSRVEEINILVNDLAAERRATIFLKRAGANLARIHFRHWSTDRVWLRDSESSGERQSAACGSRVGSRRCSGRWEFAPPGMCRRKP